MKQPSSAPDDISQRVLPPSEVRNFLMSSPACQLVGSAFDEAFYAKQVESTFGRAMRRMKGERLLVDYFQFGWREHRDPTPTFCVRQYLEANPDVESQGIEPFYHYLAHGQLEGREAYPSTYGKEAVPNPASADESKSEAESFEHQIVKPFFDAEFYKKSYPEVAGSGMDPISHYLSQGWLEGRDPSPEFSTTQYLNMNPDVQGAAMNPLIHYAVAGHEEGRPARDPGGWKAKVLAELAPLERRVQSWLKRPPLRTIEARELAEQLRTTLVGRELDGAVLSLVHDRYYENTGGIQVCVSEEQAFLNEYGYTYIAVSPYQPLPRLAVEDISCWLCEISVDGVPVGVTTGITALEVLSNQLGGLQAHLCIHSLLGHNPSWVEQLASRVSFVSHHFWVHDFFTLCEGFNLLRNDVSFCAAPPVASNSCQLCVYGPGRRMHLSRLRSLFNRLPFTVVAPSEGALKLFIDRTDFPYQDKLAVPHRTFKARKGPNNPIRDKGPVRVAFLGHPASHKGWPIFQDLVNTFRHDGRYEFFHFGQTSDQAFPGVQVNVRYSPSQPNAMQAALEENRVDVALVLSTWPETFCLTAHEAMAAGCLVFALQHSGHVVDLIGETSQGLVFASEEEIVNCFQDGSARTLALKHRQRGRSMSELISSAITSHLIMARGSKRIPTKVGRD